MDDWHSGFCPTLGYRERLTQEVGGLVPAFQRSGFFLLFGHWRITSPYSFFDVHSSFGAANEILYTLRTIG
jgi:hypothetical protein